MRDVLSGNGILDFVRDAFVQEWDLQFSVARERDIRICAEAFMRVCDYHILSRDHGIIPDPTQTAGKIPMKAMFNLIGHAI